MMFNENTISIAKEYIPTYCVDGIKVEVMFDIKTKLFVEESQEDLLAYIIINNLVKKKMILIQNLVFRKDY